MPPRLAKLVAILIAGVLIGGAFWYRGRGDGGNDGARKPPGGSETLKIVCVTELADVCNALADVDVTIEDAGTTADALAKLDGPPPFDAWVTLDPWPAMVEVQRGAGGDPLFPATAVRVASTTLVALTIPEARNCAKKWKCLADKAGTAQRVGFPDDASALSALLEGWAASGLVGNADFGNEAFPRIIDPLQILLRSGTRAANSEQLDQLATRPGSYAVVGALQHDAQQIESSTRGSQRGLGIAQTKPPARADVVVAPLVAGTPAVRLKGLFTGDNGRNALRDSGWTVPAAAGPTGLPDPDVLVALREAIK